MSIKLNSRQLFLLAVILLHLVWSVATVASLFAVSDAAKATFSPLVSLSKDSSGLAGVVLSEEARQKGTLDEGTALREARFDTLSAATGAVLQPFLPTLVAGASRRALQGMPSLR